MSNKIPAVAFAFLSPDALRVFLEIKNFRVSVFTGAEESLNLRQDKPSRNMVILPNFVKRAALAPFADQIGHLICLTDGYHEPIIEHDIPILDAIVDGDILRQAKARSPHWYIKKILEASVALSLGTPTTQPKRSVETVMPTTIDKWLDVIDVACPDGTDFARMVEYPLCQYLVGDSSRQDLQAALKALVAAGAVGDTIKKFYKWLTVKYADTMSEAMQAYLQPRSADKAPTAEQVAKRFRVDQTDIELLENIYLEVQQQTEEELGDDDE